MKGKALRFYLRSCARETLLVIANFSDTPVAVSLPETVKAFQWKRVLANREKTAPSMEGRVLWLPWEAEVYSLSK